MIDEVLIGWYTRRKRGQMRTKSTSNETIKQINNGNEGNVREEVVDNY